MAIAGAGELALLAAGVKGGLDRSRAFASATTTTAAAAAAAISLCRSAASTPAPHHLRLPPPARSAAACFSGSAMRVGRRNSFFGPGSSGAGAYQARPDQRIGGTANATGDGTTVFNALNMERTFKVALLILLVQAVHKSSLFQKIVCFLREKLGSKKMRSTLSLGLLGVCFCVGLLAAKGDERALLLTTICDKCDKVYKITTIVIALLFG